MKILAFECSTAIASVAVLGDGKIIGEQTVEAGRRHSEQLLPMADSLLTSLGLSLRDIDSVACSVGPGSFTGVRIGAATVKGLGFGTGKPCVGVSSLEALAYGCIGGQRKNSPTVICPVIGCRRGNVYNALFRWEGDGIIRLCPDRIIGCTELARELVQLAEPTVICGDESSAVAALCPESLLRQPPGSITPSAVGTARLAYKLLREGGEYTDIALSPDYLRPCQAERERLGEEE